jgi:hypothetical protein
VEAIVSLQWFFASVLTGVGEAIKPLINALRSPEAFGAFLANYGYDSLVTDIQQIEPKFISVKAAYDAVQRAAEKVNDLREQENPSLVEIGKAVQGLSISVTELIRAIDGLKEITDHATLPAPLNQEQFWKDLPSELPGSLLHRYLKSHNPKLWGTLTVLGILSTEFINEISLTGTSRSPYIRRQVNWERIGRIVSHPNKFMSEVYGLGNTFAHERLVRSLAILANTLGLPAAPTELSEVVFTTYYSDNVAAKEMIRQLLVPLYFDVVEMGRAFGFASLELILAPIPPPGDPESPPAGFVFFPVLQGRAGKEFRILENVEASLQGGFESANALRLEVQPGTVRVVAPPELGNTIDAISKLTISQEKALILLGTEGSSRFEVARLSVALSARGPMAELEYKAELTAEDTTLVIYFIEGDGFIQKVLPKEGLQVRLDFQLGWSNKKGFYFGTSAGLELTIPVHVSLAGVINVDSVYLAIRTSTQTSDINAILAASASVKLGPLTTSIDRVGLLAQLTFPPNGGNLGPADLQFKFKPPTGIGLSIDSGGFKGGGFLAFDPDNARYAGVLELEFKETIALKAIGLLTTRLPDGSSGFSLLIVLTAEFNPPYELGLGFKLSAVGGLLGVNRTANIERLRTGLKDNTLRSVLFPDNVIANANRIISDLNQVFPAQADRFIFGPMARITWGTPTLLTIDLGLLIEVPDPVRVLILGVLRALLPDEKAKLLHLQVNFLGVIDFEAQRFSFDASLFDSKLLSYTLSGDMAVRLIWGNDPIFLLTVGGFHPSYRPPPLNLPVLRRLSLQLLGDNPRLTLETYFAITSNTVQFGAKLELYAGAGKFNVYGFLSFDVLFQFNPFYFIASVNAKLALRVGSKSIASISLSFTLEGPTPWHAKGTASLKICWFLTVKVRFDKTFGEKRITTLPDVPVLPLLKEALSQQGNWKALPPSERHLLVSFTELGAGDQVVAHPFGVLIVSQKVVPLNASIQKFGSQKPADGNRFVIEQVQVVAKPGETETLSTTNVKEQFAPAQFFEMPDAQKLSRKSFEQYDSGIKVTDSEELDAIYAARRDVAYELFYIDAQRDLQPWDDLLTLDGQAFDTWATGGAIADSPLSFARRAKSALAPDTVGVQQEQFAVVNMSNMQPVNGNGLLASEAEAYSLMRDLILKDAALDGEVQVVSSFEMHRS